MSILTTGPIVNEIRGSVGSRTFSRNAYGPYVKNKLVQTNPNSPRQQNNRAIFKDAVLYWQGMNQSERQLWVQFARGRHRQDSLGIKYKVTPYNLFISCYINIVTIYGSFSIQGWRDRPIPRFTSVYTGNVFGNLSLITPGDDYHEDYYAIWSMSRQYNLSKKFVNPGRLRYAVTDEVNSGSTFQFQQLYNSIWGQNFILDPSKVIHASVKFVDGFNGLQSPTYYYRIQCILNGFVH